LAFNNEIQTEVLAFPWGESAMSEKQQKKIDELRHDIQKIKKSVEAIAIDVTQSKNLTVATGHYLEEVAKMVKDLEERCPGVAPKKQ
jgi:hypothetical protein